MLFNQKKFGIYILNERQGTGICDVAAVKSPSLSLVFYKENVTNKALQTDFFVVFRCVLYCNRMKLLC